MKKLLLIIAAWFSFAGCQYPTTRFYATDFTRYNEHGFFVSPLENIDGYKFSPISSIMLQESSEKDGYVDLMLDKLVGYAKEKGADGLIGVKFNEISRYLGHGVKSIVWRAKGIAVKFIGGSPATGEPLAAYDFEAARKFYQKYNKPLITVKDNQQMCYDTDTNTYILMDAFVAKYGNATYDMLAAVQTQEKREGGEKPMDYDAGKWDY